MNLYTLTLNECKKLASSRISIFLVLLSATTPLVGLYLRLLIMAQSITTFTILSPVKTGALLCTAFFAVFTIYEMDRVFRNNVVSIIEPKISMLQFNIAETLAIIIAAIVTVILAAFAFLPYTIFKLGDLFEPGLYVFSYFGIMLPGIVFGILLSSGFYMITRRMDISFFLFGALFFLSSSDTSHYLAAWVQTNIPAYSDSFGNALAMRTALWNRLVWFCASTAMFLLGILSTRRYEKSISQSLKINAKIIYRPALLLILIVSAAGSAIYEPYFDNSERVEYTAIADADSNMAAVQMIVTKETNKHVVLKQTLADITIIPKAAEINGKAIYSLENISNQPQEVELSLQPGYKIFSLKINGTLAPFIDMQTTIMNEKYFQVKLPANKEIKVEIDYGGKIQENREQQLALGANQISEECVFLSGRALLPGFSVNTKTAHISGKITLPAYLTLITEGDVNERVAENAEKGTNTWSFNYHNSRISLIAARYWKEKIFAGGIEVEFYYHLRHANNIKETKASEIIKESIDFYTDLLGNLDYSNLPLKIVDTSVLLMGGFASGNICCVGEGIFEPAVFDIKFEEGTTGIEVLAHEICHQWWGVGTHFNNSGAWTSEGLTVYTTAKFIQHKYGEKYAQKIGLDSWKGGMEILRRSFYYRHPEYMQVVPEEYLFNVLMENNGIVIYQQMPLQIMKAEQILGEEKFQGILAKLYRRYKNGLSYSDFLFQCGLTEEEISVE